MKKVLAVLLGMFVLVGHTGVGAAEQYRVDGLGRWARVFNYTADDSFARASVRSLDDARVTRPTPGVDKFEVRLGTEKGTLTIRFSCDVSPCRVFVQTEWP